MPHRIVNHSHLVGDSCAAAAWLCSVMDVIPTNVLTWLTAVFVLIYAVGRVIFSCIHTWRIKRGK